jgi:membrane protein DedA with SNARE-associated domain
MAASTLVTAIGIAAVGVLAVAAVSLVFYAVGRSEDRERARTEARARGSSQPRRSVTRRLVRRRGPRD